MSSGLSLRSTALRLELIEALSDALSISAPDGRATKECLFDQTVFLTDGRDALSIEIAFARTDAKMPALTGRYA